MRFQSQLESLAPDTEPSAQIFVGTSAADWIVGTPGDDFITGGGGADALAGGAGRDTFVYLAASDSNASAYDNLYDFQSGEDRIDLTAIAPTAVSIVRQGGSSFLFANSASGALQVVGAGRDFNGSDLILTGGMGIFLDNRGSGAILTGTAGSDTIRGGVGQDRVVGGAGGDILSGGGGIDTFAYVGEQDSTVNASDVILDFSSGTDRIDLTALGIHNVGVVYGATTTTNLTTIFGTTASGSQVMIRVQGAYLNSDLGISNATSASGGRDLTIGSQGVTVSSDAGFAYGTSGADDIYIEGSRSSYVIGGGGGDRIVLNGSGGARLDYRQIADSTLSAPDTIFGFVSGRDRVEFNGISGKWTYGIAYQGGDSFLFIDMGNDGSFDMLVQFNNVFLKSGDLREYSLSAPFNTAEEAAPFSEQAHHSPLIDDMATAWTVPTDHGWMELV